MKVRVWQDGITCKVTTFAPGVDVDTTWKELVKRGDVKEPFVEMEHTSLPDRNDAAGVSQRVQWKILGNSVIVDPTVRNIHKEIFNKGQEIAAVKARGNSLNAADVLDITKKQIELDNLLKEARGNA